MGFQVVEHEIRTIWAPVNFANSTDTLYEGQIVGSALASNVPSGEGLLPIGAAAGHSDTTGAAVPFGVVVGDNNATKVFDTTYKGHSIASVGSQANQLARDWRGNEGMYGKGDPQALVKVAVIGPHTVLKGPLFYGAYGTVLPTVTNTTQSTTGLTITHAALTPTVSAYNHTWYALDGKNRGLYRVGYNAGATPTSTTFYLGFPYDIEVNDTFRYCNLRVGTCMAQFDTESTYIEQSAVSYASNDYYLDVLEINLSSSGSEYVIFKFNGDQFGARRA